MSTAEQKGGRAKPRPLRFDSVRGAKAHIKANKLKVKETIRHTNGVRVQVVYPDGKPRTINIELKKKDD